MGYSTVADVRFTRRHSSRTGAHRALKTDRPVFQDIGQSGKWKVLHGSPVGREIRRQVLTVGTRRFHGNEEELSGLRAGWRRWRYHQHGTEPKRWWWWWWLLAYLTHSISISPIED